MRNLTRTRARPYHEYLGLSAGLDFETKIFAKTRAATLLRAELEKSTWRPQTLALSGVTDPYQPVERRLGITRACLGVLAEFRNPVGVITKSAMVTRDIDLLQVLAADEAASVALSITTLDEELRGLMEPRAAAPTERLKTIARLNDAGARFAGYVMLRLPHGLGFEQPEARYPPAARPAGHDTPVPPSPQ